MPRNVWRLRVFWILLVCGVALVFSLQLLVTHATPILRGRVVETLHARFKSRVELDNLNVSILHGLNVTGAGLRIYPPDEVVVAGFKAPLIAIQSFDFRVAVLGLLFKPTHVGTVHVRGLSITMPPRQLRQQDGSHSRHLGKIKITVDEIVCDDSRLVIGTDKPDKEPKVFQLKHIVLHHVGPNAPWSYDAVLTNAIPRGDIHAAGSFGPWNTDDPGDSGVSGKYRFDHADLSTIKGIGGTLHSTGSFDGKLNRIAVHGTTEVPDFSLDTANHPMPLWTRFAAIIDATSGDTYLQPIEAKLAGSIFTCQGAVISVKGKGHIINLDVDVPAGRIQDFLQLSVKTEPAVMSGILETHTKLQIRAGKESVSRKLSMTGSFTLQQIHFNSPAVESKIDMLSLRAQGDPQQAKPGAPNVQSSMTGQFVMGDGKLKFSNLDYTLPGATIRLAGVYSLDGKQFDFTGKVRTQAQLSQMVASKWKSILLKPADPLFHKHGAGAEIPVKIFGTNTAPHFGLPLAGIDLR